MGLKNYERKCKCGCGEVINLKEDKYYTMSVMSSNHYCLDAHLKDYARKELQHKLDNEPKRIRKFMKPVDDEQVTEYANFLLKRSQAQRWAKTEEGKLERHRMICSYLGIKSSR